MDFLKREETKPEASVYRPSDEETEKFFAEAERIDRAYVSVDEQKEIAVRDPFDPTHLLKVFDNFHIQIDGMANKAMGVSVKTDADLDTATLLTTQAKGLTQAIEKERVKLKEPYLKVTSVLDFETKQLKDRLVKVQAHINSLIAPYLQKKEAERREAEKKAAEEAARIQAELDEKVRLEKEAAAEKARKEAEACGIDKAGQETAAAVAMDEIEAAPVVVMEAPAEIKVQTDAGTAKLAESWDYEINDILSLPIAAFEARREQVIAALKPWITSQVKNGVRQIPGVRIFKVAKLNTRTSRGNSSGKW